MECHAGRGSKNLEWKVSDKGVASPTKIQQELGGRAQSCLVNLTQTFCLSHTAAIHHNEYLDILFVIWIYYISIEITRRV